GNPEESDWSKAYPDCGGQKQSPINLQSKKVKFNRFLKPLILSGYEEDGLEFSMTNNGHTVQIILPSTMSMKDSNGTVYKAEQMHFHWGGEFSEVSGSEHTIDGIRRVIEIHFVHYNSKYENFDEAKNQSDGLAVLAVLVEVGWNYGKQPSVLFHTVSSLLGQITTLKNTNIYNLLPEDTLHYYTYKGSLTTPPCTENVQWFVLRDTVKLSKTQVTAAPHPQSLPLTVWLTRVLPGVRLILRYLPHTGFDTVLGLLLLW
ncbi:Carbonic anhydrase 6, partial [Lemmus lemmus]